jgi:hypothetical protein
LLPTIHNINLPFTTLKSNGYFLLLPSSGSYPSTIALLSHSSSKYSSSIFIAKEENDQTKKLIFSSTKKELFPYLQGNVGLKFNSSKHDQLLMYASWSLIKVERKYNTTKKKH